MSAVFETNLNMVNENIQSLLMETFPSGVQCCGFDSEAQFAFLSAMAEFIESGLPTVCIFWKARRLPEQMAANSYSLSGSTQPDRAVSASQMQIDAR